MIYATFGEELAGLDIPRDGTVISNFFMGCLPTSRGSITLQSSDSASPSVIGPNFLATEADRFVMRESWRLLSKLMSETPEGKSVVAKKIVTEGHESLSSDAADDAIDARIRIAGITTTHPAGTASMGTVFDGSLKAKAAHNLRAVDASVVIQAILWWDRSAVTNKILHFHPTTRRRSYVIAGQAVDIILEEN